MKFSIGDKVRFVNENMDGIVSAILSNEMVGVTVDNDFEIPVLIGQIVKISFEDFSNTAATTAVVEIKTADKGFDENLYASFVQLNDQQMELYFINHTNQRVFVNYYTTKDQQLTPKFFAMVDAFDYKSVDKLAMDQFAIWPEFNFQVLIKPEQTAWSPVVKNLQVPASRFFKHLRATPILQKQGYLFLINEALNEEAIQKLATFQPRAEVAETTAAAIKAPLAIIDLHIDKIHNNYTQLTKQETLQAQLKYFEKNLEDAMAAGMKKVTFIHGVGNLKLKNEIVKVLKTNTHVKEIKDAPTDEFGYGATEVFISES